MRVSTASRGTCVPRRDRQTRRIRARVHSDQPRARMKWRAQAEHAQVPNARVDRAAGPAAAAREKANAPGAKLLPRAASAEVAPAAPVAVAAARLSCPAL